MVQEQDVPPLQSEKEDLRWITENNPSYRSYLVSCVDFDARHGRLQVRELHAVVQPDDGALLAHQVQVLAATYGCGRADRHEDTIKCCPCYTSQSLIAMDNSSE